FRPDSPIVFPTKDYAAPDGTFRLKIPQRFCVLSYQTPTGATFTDFAAAEDGGARLTILHGPAKTFGASSTLLGHVKSLADRANSLPINKGNTFTLSQGQKTSFRGQNAKITTWKMVTKGVVETGQAMEWRQGDEAFLAVWGANAKQPRAAAALRPLLDTLKFEKRSPSQPLEDSRSMLNSAQSVMTKTMQGMQSSSERMVALKFTSPVTSASAQELEDAEKERLATAPNSHRRALAALKSARLIAKLAWDAVLRGEYAQANQLFEKRNALDTESYNAEIAALRHDLKETDAEIERFGRLTPYQAVASTYNMLYGGLLTLKGMQILMMQTMAINQNDDTMREEATHLLFDLRSRELSEIQLFSEPPERTWEAMTMVAGALEDMADVAQQHADLDGGRAYLACGLDWRLAIPESYPKRNLVESLRNCAILEAALGDVRLSRDYSEAAMAEIGRTAPRREKYIATIEDKDIALMERVDWQNSKWVIANNLGVTVQQMGDYGAAETYHRQALSAAEAILEPNSMGNVRSRLRAMTLGNLAVLANDTGDGAEARRLFSETIEIYHSIVADSELAFTLRNSAGLDEDDGKFDTAIRKVETARLLFTQLGQLDNVISSHTYLSALALGKGDPARAVEEATIALRMARATPGSSALGGSARTVALAKLRELETQNGSAKLTPEQQRGLLALVQEGDEADARAATPIFEIKAHTIRGKILRAGGDLEGALTEFKAAIARQETLRANAKSAEKFSEQKSSYAIYDDAVSLLLQLNRPEEAFDMLSRSRSNKLRDVMRLTALKSNDPALNELLDRAAALDEKLAKTRARLAKEQSEPAPQRDVK
ncbi:tetratricopeptide repeat protein, partial [bacterium]